MFNLALSVKEPCNYQTMYVRKIHKINLHDFKTDLIQSDLMKHPHKSACLLSHQYFNTLRDLLDKYAPLKRKTIPKHTKTGFMNSNILQARD